METNSSLFADGRIDRAGPSIVVRIRADRSVVRQRFTLAHEIGHLLLHELRARQGLDFAFPKSNDEVTCDAFAAALLLPKSWIALTIPEVSVDVRLVCLLRMAAVAKVSPAALVNRLSTLGIHRLLLVEWMRGSDGQWRSVRTAGGPDRLDNNLVLANVPCRDLSAVWQRIQLRGGRSMYLAMAQWQVVGRARAFSLLTEIERRQI